MIRTGTEFVKCLEDVNCVDLLLESRSKYIRLYIKQLY
jgi:hypothetical protein